MDKLVFALFMVVLSSLVGVSLFGLLLSTRLMRANGKTARKRHMPKVLVKSGFTITSSVLLYALLHNGAQPTSWLSWAFLLGLVLAGAGITLFTRDSLEETVRNEVALQQDSPHASA